MLMKQLVSLHVPEDFTLCSPTGTVDEEPSSVTGRKDSLSINLEFVKVSLSRIRRAGPPTFIENLVPIKGGKVDTTLINISGIFSLSKIETSLTDDEMMLVRSMKEPVLFH